MEKIELTHEYILKSYRKTTFTFTNLWAAFVLMPILVLGIAGLVYLWSDSGLSSASWVFVVFYTPAILLVFITGLHFYFLRPFYYLQIKKKNYRIVSDTLKKIIGRKTDNLEGCLPKSARFYFTSGRRFRPFLHFDIETIAHPIDSHAGVDHRVENGDTFYLVMVGNRIVSIFNERAFDYKA